MSACKLAALTPNEHERFEKVKKSSSKNLLRSEKKESEFCGISPAPTCSGCAILLENSLLENIQQLIKK